MIEWIKIPKTCPTCGSLLEINNNDGVLTLLCPNEACESKLLNKLVLKRELILKDFQKQLLKN